MKSDDSGTAAAECEWCLLCTRPADGTRSHPVLGDVPICGPCDAKGDRITAARV